MRGGFEPLLAGRGHPSESLAGQYRPTVEMSLRTKSFKKYYWENFVSGPRAYNHWLLPAVSLILSYGYAKFWNNCFVFALATGKLPIILMTHLSLLYRTLSYLFLCSNPTSCTFFFSLILHLLIFCPLYVFPKSDIALFLEGNSYE